MRIWILILTCFLSISSFAGQETHGGNGLTAEFLALFDELVSTPKNAVCYSLLPGEAPLADLMILRMELQIQSQPVVLKDGVEVGALNFPKQFPRLVIVSEKKWAASSTEQKKALILHEILYLIGIDEGDLKQSPWPYYHSSKVFNCLNEVAHQPEWHTSSDSIVTCNEKYISEIQRDDLLEFVSDFPRKESTLASYFLGEGCTQGLALLQKESLLKCDGPCLNAACSLTGRGSLPSHNNTQPPTKIDFLESLLKQFPKELDLSVCEWELCQEPSTKSQLPTHPFLKKQCEGR